MDFFLFADFLVRFSDLVVFGFEPNPVGLLCSVDLELFSYKMSHALATNTVA